MNLDFPSLGSQFATLVIKPEARKLAGIITDFLYENNFAVVGRYTLKFPESKLPDFYNVVQNPEWNPEKYFKHMTSDDSIVLFLSYENPTSDAQKKLKSLIGDKDPDNAAPGTLRHYLRNDLKKIWGDLFVNDGVYRLNGVHCADDRARAGYETCVLFGEEVLFGEIRYFF